MADERRRESVAEPCREDVRPGGRGAVATAAYRAVRLVMFDVDGVLTDGRVCLDGHGGETKIFDVRDGTGITLLRYAGLQLALLSGRGSPATRLRARELHIPPLHISENAHRKVPAYERLLALCAVRDAEVAYVGDDVIDLPILQRAGLACCPGDARAEVQAACHLVASAPGGRGAVRLLAEHLLKQRQDGTWERALGRYLGTVAP